MDRKPQSTIIPGSVQAKMQTGVRQRYAMGTTPSAQPKSEKPRNG